MICKGARFCHRTGTAREGACRQSPAGFCGERELLAIRAAQARSKIRSSSRLRLDVRPRRASVADETGTKAATRDDTGGTATGRVVVIREDRLKQQQTARLMNTKKIRRSNLLHTISICKQISGSKPGFVP